MATETAPIVHADNVEFSDSQDGAAPVLNSAVFTETLANIYIKQGKYEKAYEILKRI